MYHTIIVVGRLGRDPEMRYTPSGQAVTTFNVATDYSTKSPDGNWEKKPSGSGSPSGANRLKPPASTSKKAGKCWSKAG